MWYLAFKHLFGRKIQTLFTLVGILLGSAGYVVFSGIQLGFQEYMIDRLLNSDGYVTITPREEFITDKSVQSLFYPNESLYWEKKPSGRRAYTELTQIQNWYDALSKNPEVVAYAPQYAQEVIFSYGGFSVTGVLTGIDPDKQKKVTNLEQDVVKGKIQDLNQGGALIMIGEDLMKYLGANLNDTINVVNPGGEVFPAKIVAVFNTGNRRVDEQNAYSSLSTAQNVGRAPQEISKIIVRLRSSGIASSVAKELSVLGKDKVESWDQANENMMSMMSTQDIVRNATTFAFILVVAFSIYNILNMVVNHKKRDIAILRSMGFDGKETTFLFLFQGLFVGFFGAFLGLGVGYLACLYIQTIPIPGRGHMMISWDLAIYVKGFLLVFLSSSLASFVPARSAGKLSPIEIIRGSL